MEFVVLFVASVLVNATMLAYCTFRYELDRSDLVDLVWFTGSLTVIEWAAGCIVPFVIIWRFC